MEQMFLLKHYAKLSLQEQLMLSAEDRNWWLTRLEKENAKNKDQVR
jgi:hypothetical protein